MARLKNPQNNRDAIRQDYHDKHASDGGVLLCRKYPPRPVIGKDGQPVPGKVWYPWYNDKVLTVNETKYVNANHFFSEEKHNDCYATLNHFPTEYPPEVFLATHEGGTYRTSDNLAYLTGFYIDFDNRKIHDIAKNQQAQAELVEEALSYAELIEQTLVDYLPKGYTKPSLVPGNIEITEDDDFGMPVISYTGGGFGFYFPLKPLIATEENKERYMEVYEKLYRRFSSLFEMLLDVFENDHAVVGSERVIRVTGTYNSKTGTYSRNIARYGNAATNEVYRYRLGDIYDLYRLQEITIDSPKEEPNARLVKDSPLQKERKEKREKKEAQGSEKSAKELNYAKKGNVAYPVKWYQGWCNGKQLGRYLDLAVTSLQYLDGQGALQRNNALFLVACLKTEIEMAKRGYYILDRSPQVWQRDIIFYMADLNDGLTEPLDATEFAALVNSAMTNKYHFRRRDTIQKFLNLTDQEFEALGWLDKQKKEQEKQERNNAMTDMDKDVIKLYLSGLSDAKIADALGITKRTSINIRQRLGVLDRSAKWEDIDFDGNKRHVKHTKSEAPAPTPIIPYMPWYTPTYRSMHYNGYKMTDNAVAERAKKLAEISGDYTKWVETVAEGKAKEAEILAEVAEWNKRAEELQRQAAEQRRQEEQRPRPSARMLAMVAAHNRRVEEQRRQAL